MVYVLDEQKELKKQYSEDKRYVCVKVDAKGYFFELVTVAYHGGDPADSFGYRNRE